MDGLVDLHCHCVPGIDDGARSIEESLEILQALKSIGFGHVVTTPHMRPGMFDNTAQSLRSAFAQLEPNLQTTANMPIVELACEHFFDDVVFQTLMNRTGLPYPGEHAVLLEFYTSEFPLTIDHRLADLRRCGYLPVIAHPERYEPLWKKPEVLERLLDLGCVALLDAAALVGRYGRRPERCSRDMLERGLYAAACSDSHRIADVQATERSIDWLCREYGDEEVQSLFVSGPRSILSGQSG